MIVNMNILVDSASPVSFLNAKRVTRAEIKMKIQIHTVNKRNKQLYSGFTENTIDILDKIVLRTQSNWRIFICEDHFFLLGWTRKKYPATAS